MYNLIGFFAIVDGLRKVLVLLYVGRKLGQRFDFGIGFMIYVIKCES